MARRRLPDELQPGEVLVQISLATICGSDLHTVDGRRSAPTPCVLGHEAVGHVVAQRAGRHFRRTARDVDAGGQLRALRALHALASAAEVRPSFQIRPRRAQRRQRAQWLLCQPHRAASRHAHPAGAGRVCRMPSSRRPTARSPPSSMRWRRCPIPATARSCRAADCSGIYACAWLRHRGVREVFCTDLSPQRLALVAEFGGIPGPVRRRCRRTWISCSKSPAVPP